MSSEHDQPARPVSAADAAQRAAELAHAMAQVLNLAALFASPRLLNQAFARAMVAAYGHPAAGRWEDHSFAEDAGEALLWPDEEAEPAD